MFHVEHAAAFQDVRHHVRFEESQKTLAAKGRNFFRQNLAVACAQLGCHIIDKQYGAYVASGVQQLRLGKKHSGRQNFLLPSRYPVTRRGSGDRYTKIRAVRSLLGKTRTCILIQRCGERCTIAVVSTPPTVVFKDYRLVAEQFRCLARQVRMQMVYVGPAGGIDNFGRSDELCVPNDDVGLGHTRFERSVSLF